MFLKNSFLFKIFERFHAHTNWLGHLMTGGESAWEISRLTSQLSLPLCTRRTMPMISIVIWHLENYIHASLSRHAFFWIYKKLLPDFGQTCFHELQTSSCGLRRRTLWKISECCEPAGATPLEKSVSCKSLFVP